jgi:soluble lytic murein transglycosylase
MPRFPLFFLLAFFGLLAAPDASWADYYATAFKAADQKNWSKALNAATSTKQNWMRDYILWRKYRTRTGRGSARQMLEFLQSHRDWPEQERLIKRTAEALLLEGYSAEQEQRWQNASRIKEKLFDYGWIHGSFSGDEQRRVLERYRKQLSPRKIEARADRLLWDNEATRAKALLSYGSKAFRNIAEARIAYITKARDHKRKLNRLTRQQQRDDGLLFARINYHKKKRQHKTAEKLLKQVPSKVAHGAKWWPLWRFYAREAIGEKRYRDALAILNPIQKAERGTQAQLFWLRGWVKLQFMSQPAEAYKDFYAFHKYVGTPISKSRGAFWAGLAAQQNGNIKISRNWFHEAARYPMSFYGQMAVLKLGNGQKLKLSKQSIGESDFSEFHRHKVLLRKLAQHEQDYSVNAFFLKLATLADRSGELVSLANYARRLGYPHLAIRIGKKYFASEGKWVQPVSHPIPNIPNGLAIEPSLALAITRQESEFNPNAKSSADARGLMQLLPPTAKLVAKEHGISHRTSMLNNPTHNMKLGSLYLAGLIEKFDGHYPLAIAGYNAGPGRVVSWLKRFGPFPQKPEAQLKWLEQIPFSETRNYVQRVTENLQTYRRLLRNNDRLTGHKMFHR